MKLNNTTFKRNASSPYPQRATPASYNFTDPLYLTGAYEIWHKANQIWQEENGGSGDSEESIETEQGYYNNGAENGNR